MKGLAFCVTLLERAGGLFTDRAFPFAVGCLPGEAVLLSWTANDLLCVLIYHRAIMFLLGVFMLRFVKAAADIDRG